MTTSAPFPDHHRAAPLAAHVGSTGTAAATTHHLATRAAHDVMAAGGNAVDAAVAANAVVGVVAPDTSGPGGDLFALVHVPGRSLPLALNASGRAGSGAFARDVRNTGAVQIPLRSPWTVTIPGCVDGWEAMLTELGSRSLADMLAPAIAAAEDGFEVSPELADSLLRIHDMIGAQRSAQALYPEGAPPRAGTAIARPDLAATLSALADDGRDAFYGGPVGAGITEATNGMVTSGDLAESQAEWVEPLRLQVFGLDGWTIPPNSQGYLTLAALWVAERIGPSPDPEDPAYHHALIEAYRAVAWDRDGLVADPATAPLSPQDLVEPGRLQVRTERIDAETTATWPPSTPALGGTMYLCTRDSSGLAVSLIQSNFHGIGSGLAAGATGVFLQNRGAGFTLRPGHPNELAPGRRPFHTLSPTLWTSDGRLRLVLGTRGGQYQPQLLVQLAAHHLFAGLPLHVAMAQPRWTVDHWGPGEEHVVTAEQATKQRVIEGLRTRGHHVDMSDGWRSGWGPVAAISETPDGVEVAGDPRVSTSGVAVG